MVERGFSVYQTSWILKFYCIHPLRWYIQEARINFRNGNSTSACAKSEHSIYRFNLLMHFTIRLCLTELRRQCAENTLKGIDQILIPQSYYCHRNIVVYVKMFIMHLISELSDIPAIRDIASWRQYLKGKKGQEEFPICILVSIETNPEERTS